MSKTQIFQLFAGLAGLLGVSLQIIQDGWGMLLYYTVLSNIIVFIFQFYLVAFEARKGTINYDGRLIRLKGGVMMSIAITFLVYHFLLSPYVSHNDYWNIRNFLVHYIAPLCYIIDTIFLDRKDSYKSLDPLSWTILPLAYFAFAIFNGLVTQFVIPGSPDSPYAYYFLNLNKYGFKGVFNNTLFIFLAYVLIGYLFFYLKKVLGRPATAQVRK